MVIKNLSVIVCTCMDGGVVLLKVTGYR